MNNKNKSVKMGQQSDRWSRPKPLNLGDRVRSSTHDLMWRCLLLRTKLGEENLVGDTFDSHTSLAYD